LPRQFCFNFAGAGSYVTVFLPYRQPEGQRSDLRSQNKLALVEGFSRGNSLPEFPAMPAVFDRH
jgi:hypothetical protein